MEGLLEMRRAIFADRQQAICQTTRPFTTHAIEALAHGLRNSDGHTLSSNARELLGQSVCFLAFDVQAHGYASLPTSRTILPDAWATQYLKSSPRRRTRM